MTKKEENQNQLVVSLGDAVTKGISSQKLQHFEKAFVLAESVESLKTLLTPAVLKPILSLKNTSLGFRTDERASYVDYSGKTKKGVSYSLETTRDCIIEALLYGVNITGNQFNIISYKTYITKEGYAYLLKHIKETEDFTYRETAGLPEAINTKSAKIKMTYTWTYNGKEGSQIVERTIKADSYATADSIIGKGERKGRKWLYEYITGLLTPDGDAEDNTLLNPEDKLKNAGETDFTVLTENSNSELEKEETVDYLEKALEVVEKSPVSILDIVNCLVHNNQLEKVIPFEKLNPSFFEEIVKKPRIINTTLNYLEAFPSKEKKV